MSEATPDVTPQLLEALSRRFTQTVPTALEAASEVTAERWSYREAAAVLHCFDPGRLRPVNPNFMVDSPRALLFSDTVPAIGGREEGLHALKPEIRQEALRRLGSRESLRAALDANPDRPKTDVQRMLEAWLAGKAPLLETQSYEELNQTVQVVSWLGEVIPDLPKEARVRDLLSRRSVLRPFEHLVRQDFVGRKSELEKLRDYVGVLPPSSFTSKAVRYFNSLRKLQPALLLHGPGGVGKSALVGRFLYEHSEAPPELRFPFAYLPFDNPLLQASEPYTLLVEAAEQLARQYPEREEVHERFRRRIESYRTARASLGGRATGSGTRSAKLDEVSRLDQSLFEEFGDLLKELAGTGDAGRPVLLVLDTFEEVQYRPPQELVGLSRMLGTLQARFPALRIVASGRAPAEDLLLQGRAPKPMPLEPLDPASARQLLALQGVSDPKLADSMVRQLGSNPLTLKLAARAVASHPELSGNEGLEGITTRRFGVFPVSQELIQGQLYRRVLGHIHDPDVRKLAHPGMVLRRVTPETIREVLSRPCGVEVPDEGTALRLFQELRREHSLVRLEDVNTLQYRPEIRQPMLRLLEREKPAQVREIHQVAIDFWQAREGAAARAEELYHRLALDQEAWQLESRWLPEAGTSLAASREELPPRAAAWLASHLGLRLDAETQEAATQADWERSVGRQVASLLRYQQVEHALADLGERSERLPGSALYPLEARAHLLAGEPRKALEVLERGLESMPLTGNPGRHAEMLWLHAEAAAALSHFGIADASLARAEIVARDIADPLCRLQILTQRLLLLRRRGLEGGAEVLRDVLARTLQRLDEVHMDREPALVRLAVSELAPEQWPGLLRKIVEAVGIGALEPGAESALRAALSAEGLPQSQSSSLDALLHRELATSKDTGPIGAAVIAALRSQGLTLDAANLAGIEEYREPWETEISEEASA